MNLSATCVFLHGGEACFVKLVCVTNMSVTRSNTCCSRTSGLVCVCPGTSLVFKQVARIKYKDMHQ